MTFLPLMDGGENCYRPPATNYLCNIVGSESRAAFLLVVQRHTTAFIYPSVILFSKHCCIQRSCIAHCNCLELIAITIIIMGNSSSSTNDESSKYKEEEEVTASFANYSPFKGDKAEGGGDKTPSKHTSEKSDKSFHNTK